jgi:hypothetical protein
MCICSFKNFSGVIPRTSLNREGKREGGREEETNAGEEWWEGKEYQMKGVGIDRGEGMG